MHILLSIAIFLLGCFSAYRFYSYYNYKTFENSLRLQNISTLKQQEDKRLKARDKTEKLLKCLSGFTKRIVLFMPTQRERDKLDYYARRLNLNWNGVLLDCDDLLTIRSAVQTIYIVIVIILSLINLRLSALLLLYKFIAVIFDSLLESEIKEHNKLLLKDFRDFYAEFYYNYRHKNNRGIKIQEVAMRYYDRANSETKLLIDNLRADSIQSEEYALDQMKDLFRIVKVHRLADQVKMIIMGKTLNTDAMDGFKQELEAEFRNEKRKILEAKKFKATAVTGVAWFVISEVVLLFGIFAMIGK